MATIKLNRVYITEHSKKTKHVKNLTSNKNFTNTNIITNKTCMMETQNLI